MNELKYAEKERVIEELEDEYDRRLEHGESVSSINFKIQGIELYLFVSLVIVIRLTMKREEAGETENDEMAQIDAIDDNATNNNYNNSNNNNSNYRASIYQGGEAALARRVANLEAKMDLILQKLDQLLVVA